MAWCEGVHGALGGPVAIQPRSASPLAPVADRLAAETLFSCGVMSERVLGSPPRDAGFDFGTRGGRI